MAATKPISPKKYLSEHEMTGRMKRLGLKPRQLSGVRFKTNDGDEFRDWRVIADTPWPIELLADMHAWCTFRWLILDNPPASRDRRDAWEHVSLYLAEPIFQAARKKKADLDGGRDIANEQKKTAADEAALALFADWETKRLAVLKDKTAHERVAAYLSRELKDRHKRRIRRLFKDGKIKIQK